MTELLTYKARRWYRRLEHSLGSGEVVVDIFAGGGGASTGIEDEIGRPVDVAINHDPKAIAIHRINHPDTHHFQCDIREVDPRQVLPGRQIGLLWGSPDCTHHSRAKGGKPVKRGRRALANVLIVWAAARLPRVIMLENVQEFMDWGPLNDADMPDKTRKGQSFIRWKNKLVRLGYHVEYKILVAADYGVPTIRKRLFLIARRDGKAIVWPPRTHAPRDKAEALGLLPWRQAADCIDFGIPTRSIFGRKKDLAKNTMARIASGLFRYVLESSDPYTLPVGDGAAMAPVISQSSHGGTTHDPRKPMNTITATPMGGDLQVIQPYLTLLNHSGKGFRGQSVKTPLPTLTASRDAHGLVQAFMVKASQRQGSRSLKEPKPAVTTGNKESLAMVFLNKHYTGVVGQAVTKPLGTITSQDHHSLTAVWLEKFYSTARRGADIRDPMPTVTGGGYHIGKVSAFLVKYFGTATAEDLKDPMHTVTGKARFGLVVVNGDVYQITDIGLRMLTAMELLRAQFGRFAKGYKLIGNIAEQISAIGNSVPPEVAAKLVAANY